MTELPKITTAEAFERIISSRAKFAALWDGLTKDQMTQIPGPQDDWSVKDLIVHITWWENFTLARLTMLLTGLDKPDIPDYDALNYQVWHINKDRTLENVIAEFDLNLSRWEDMMNALTDDQLNDLDGFSTPLVSLIAGNSFGHYDEHRPDLEAYVASLG